jgi:hypothetical protein
MRKHRKEYSSDWEISFKKSLVRGSIPKDSSVRGSSPGWKDTFIIDEKRGVYVVAEKNQRTILRSTCKI